MKRKPSEWEKIFANEATEKGLISKIYKQLVKISNTHTQITQSKNGLKIFLTFFQRYTDGYKAHEKMCKITNFQINANQYYNEVSPYMGQNDNNKKKSVSNKC